ncbi:hypothetical protein B0H12DRAFT_317001 [Mycena haematopus]|nr:hypothetical protein B0H12DRAFT_317001 [Mycena haematopus]
MEEDETTIAQAVRLQNELHLISISFLYWDHCLTFSDEVRFLWRKAKTRSTYYFFLNRYFAFFGDVAITVFHFAAVPISVCTHVNIFRELLLVINQCLVCLLLTLRIYALYGRDIRVYVGMLGFGVVLLGISCWALVGKNGVPQTNVVGCHVNNSRERGVYLAVPWEALLVYDVVIFLALFYKSFQTRAESPTLRWHTPLLSLLVRDGAIYFAIMAAMNFANILTFYIATPLLRGCLSTMASCIHLRELTIRRFWRWTRAGYPANTRSRAECNYACACGPRRISGVSLLEMQHIIQTDVHERIIDTVAIIVAHEVEKKNTWWVGYESFRRNYFLRNVRS